MSNNENINQEEIKENKKEDSLEGGAYEIIQKRLKGQADELLKNIQSINNERKQVFGALENSILSTDHLITKNNCIPRDIISFNHHLIIGYNVYIGLKKETKISDVFSIYEYKDKQFHDLSDKLLHNPQFIKDFKDLYNYYKHTRFANFMKKGSELLMAFHISDKSNEVKVFKWQINPDKTLSYIDNRSDRDYRFPPQQDFDWIKTTRESHIYGRHPHVSIEDRVFVETVGGDLTVKVEDNTEDGSGIYSEDVVHKDQTLDDGEIYYTVLANIIILKILPYKEENYRYLIFNENNQQVIREDDLGQCAIRLADDDGIIFPKGYYLKSGEYKAFNLESEDMIFFKLIKSLNGEDYLYLFYHEKLGDYVLLQYNVISKKVETPISCQGLTIFDDGTMILIRAESEAKKSHAIQIWRTPFVSDPSYFKVDKSNQLSKIGNRELVRGIADLQSIYNLIQYDEIYLGHYQEIVKQCINTLDLHFWFDTSGIANPKKVIQDIKDAANSAIDEFEKVLEIKKDTESQLTHAESNTKDLIKKIAQSDFKNIDDYVVYMKEVKIALGKSISLKELRYVDLQRVGSIEEKLNEHYQDLSNHCVDFLLGDNALLPYLDKLNEIEKNILEIEKISELKDMSSQMEDLNQSIGLLSDLVNSLNIEDSTQSAEIIESLSGVFSRINQVKAVYKDQYKKLSSKEASVEFNAQFNLIAQSIENYLDQSDSPEKCDEYLTKLMVQLDELDGKFVDFDDYLEKISEKREDIISGFNSKKVQLEEKRNKRSQTLWNSADRILKGINSKLESLSEINELNAYFASDPLVSRARDIIKQLLDLGDSVKSEELASRLKSLQLEGSRQLKDKLDLYADGDHIISLGDHKFTVNTQNISLTTVIRDGNMYFHLTGTEFYELIDDSDFQLTKPFWDQDYISETKDIYRAEYLSHQFIQSVINYSDPINEDQLSDIIVKPDKLLLFIKDFMSERFNEGYEKGIHDEDALHIIKEMFPIWKNANVLRFHPMTRAYAWLYWLYNSKNLSERELLEKKIQSLSYLVKISKSTKSQESKEDYINELGELIRPFYSENNIIIEEKYLKHAPEYLFHELISSKGEIKFSVNYNAVKIYKGFESFLTRNEIKDKFQDSLKAVENDLPSQLDITRDWLGFYLDRSRNNYDRNYFLEAQLLILHKGSWNMAESDDIKTKFTVKGLRGHHNKIKENELEMDLSDFIVELDQYQNSTVPQYESYNEIKHRLVQSKKEEMKLSEFEPKIMSSFVRNQLIDKTYLPIIGTNLAKQMGSYGKEKRSDLMGLLLLISPPGYGKTTLMEYIANRLGLIFVKINGPAIGHRVSSLDPNEAVNATAKNEIERLNLALEMANNVMIYLDDIQHCNPELLQKFISLCDAQRKIEGVYKGKTKTYDLKGKKVAVVMAGNPYTESGEKFRIPDMLANRADTYNLGDIIGGNEDQFKLSYLENALTSNSILRKLSSRSQKDVYQMIEIAKTGNVEGREFQVHYSMDEVKEIVNIFKKLFIIQDVVLKINQQYIYSASQDDNFRSEPPFLLQGSYRNMNKMVEKIHPLMNKDEVKQLISDHYNDESQLLTSGAEFNFLKFKEMVNWISEDEQKRLDFIRKTFQKNLALGEVQKGDSMSQISANLNRVNENFERLIEIFINLRK